MSETTPAYEDIIAGAIARQTANLRVSLPGRVESYDAARQSATVQPLILDGEIDPDSGERVVLRIPPVTDVPIVFPGSGAFRITWPVQRGDTVLLVFSSSSLDLWLARGGEVDPADDRRHNVSDAIAIPGLFDFAHVPTEAPTNAMTIHAGTLQLGGPLASQAVLKGDQFLTALDVMLTAIATAIAGLPAGAGTAAAAAINTARTTVFNPAATASKSTIVKVL